MLKCEICGEEIEPGEKYYEFPDGTIVCDHDYQCLVDYCSEHYEHFAQED